MRDIQSKILKSIVGITYVEPNRVSNLIIFMQLDLKMKES